MTTDPQVAPTAEELAAVLSADGVLVLRSDGRILSVADLWPPDPLASTLRLPVGFGVTGMVARSGLPQLLKADSPRNRVHRQLLRLKPHQTVARMCLPMFGLEGTVVGVLAAHRRPTLPFTQDEMAVGTSYAGVLGLRLHAEQLWNTVHRQRSERDRLIEQAISAQEAERRRIAFDLHDGVTTALASMSFHLSAASLSVADLSQAGPGSPGAAEVLERVRSELGSARELADLAYSQTRAAISGLHSLVLDDLGLVAALESLAQNVVTEGSPQVDLVVDPEVALDDLPDHAAAALYRIAQEALGNAVRHAQADRVVLSLRRMGSSVVLGCADDGVGFDPTEQRSSRALGDGAEHFGLSSIAERCALIEASLRIESTPGRGTTLLVELPL